MIHIDHHIVLPLIEQARASVRRRKNYNFHPTAADPLHRMLHAMEPDTYVQPHKHEDPAKHEAFLVLKGRVIAIVYNDKGDITDWSILDPETGNYGMEVAPGEWHSLVCLESGTVVYEVKDGPWNPSDDKFFASWAPKEGDAGCDAFNRKVLEIIGLK
jgi:cupin fold WbuC family metalloprotein